MCDLLCVFFSVDFLLAIKYRALKVCPVSVNYKSCTLRISGCLLVTV